MSPPAQLLFLGGYLHSARVREQLLVKFDSDDRQTETDPTPSAVSVPQLGPTGVTSSGTSCPFS